MLFQEKFAQKIKILYFLSKLNFYPILAISRFSDVNKNMSGTLTSILHYSSLEMPEKRVFSAFRALYKFFQDHFYNLATWEQNRNIRLTQ